MRATIMYGTRDVRVEEVPDAVLVEPTDAVVKVVAACVCGSDLWPYRGVEPVTEPKRMGHEAVGVVAQAGAGVRDVAVGDFVVVCMFNSCGQCVNCRGGWPTGCLTRTFYGAPQNSATASMDAQQGELLRVPRADSNLVKVPGVDPTSEAGRALIPSLLTLADVMCTGHHAAVSALVGTGSTVAVVGDGAVGLCAVVAAHRLGAERIVAMSRHADRSALATQFGATDIVPERGDEGVQVLHEMFEGVGPHAVLECVGTKESMDQALRSARPGGQVGFVGVPAGGPELSVGQMFNSNVGVRGGLAPIRVYIDQLLPDVLNGSIAPGAVFDLELPLAEAAEAYKAMDERRATKVLLWP